jgi:hypothetical protein
MDNSLLASIQAGKKLKQTKTNQNNSNSNISTSAPTPRINSSSTSNNIVKSDVKVDQPPQLAGLFAGGMPTLKKSNPTRVNGAPVSIPGELAFFPVNSTLLHDARLLRAEVMDSLTSSHHQIDRFRHI